MNIKLVTYGSRGDIQPILGLALGLRGAGHQVLLAGPPEYGQWAEQQGCPFAAFGGNFKAKAAGLSDPHRLRSAAGFIGFMRRELRKQLRQLPGIVAGADLVLGASLALGAPTAAQLAGSAYGYIGLCPQVLPSGSHPSLLFRHHQLPGWFNRASWRLTGRIDDFTVGGVLNQERGRLGLPRVVNVWQHLLGDRVMVASDPVLGAVPEDVAQKTVQVGYIHWAGEEGVSEVVARFLASRPPPVYLGFGSMMMKDPAEMVRLAHSLNRAVGVPVIMARGWTREGGPDPGAGCLALTEVPHRELLPKVAAAVHHGGSGTTAAATRAGIPQVIVPHLLDQFYWADSVYRRGLGPRPLPRFRLSPRRLARSVRVCLADEMMKSRAGQVARAVQSTDGLARAVEAIESGFFDPGNRPRDLPKTDPIEP